MDWRLASQSRNGILARASFRGPTSSTTPATNDQLGSIREVVDATGAVRADYRYSTYGERTRQSGDLDTDWGYAGLWHHAPSGLDLATHRIYDSTLEWES